MSKTYVKLTWDYEGVTGSWQSFPTRALAVAFADALVADGKSSSLKIDGEDYVPDRKAPTKEGSAARAEGERSEPLVTDDDLRAAIACCKDSTPDHHSIVRVHKGFLDTLVRAAELSQSLRSPPGGGGLGQVPPQTAPHPSRAAFVVERYIGGTLNYYCAGARGRGNADDWTIDYEWATKFADNDSAQMALFHLCNKEGRVAEHAMIAA